jgi:hypothetical protein
LISAFSDASNTKTIPIYILNKKNSQYRLASGFVWINTE